MIVVRFASFSFRLLPVGFILVPSPINAQATSGGESVIESGGPEQRGRQSCSAVIYLLCSSAALQYGFAFNCALARWAVWRRPAKPRPQSPSAEKYRRYNLPNLCSAVIPGGEGRKARKAQSPSAEIPTLQPCKKTTTFNHTSGAKSESRRGEDFSQFFCDLGVSYAGT